LKNLEVSSNEGFKPKWLNLNLWWVCLAKSRSSSKNAGTCYLVIQFSKVLSPCYLILRVFGPLLCILIDRVFPDSLNPPSLGCHFWFKPGLLDELLRHCSQIEKQQEKQV
jgi:hypothetical protein